MALSNENIDRVNRICSTIKRFGDTDFVSDKLSIVRAHVDYEKFINSTEVGKKIDDKLVALMNALTEVYDAFNTVNEMTLKYAQQQRRLNNSSFLE